MNIAIIGGGAAGFFAAITAAESNPECKVVIFERGKNVLEKVRISGGGRCNVTHACFDARELVKNYPRGSRELLGPFLQFGPEQTVEWYARRGVNLKTESDGRMFPVTDSSQTIVDCLERSAFRAGVEVRLGARVDQLEPLPDGAWRVGSETFDKVMVASGSNPAMWEKLRGLGHQIVSPAPSLFTFNTKDTRLRDLAGVSVAQVELRVPGTRLKSQGPLLVTHWGLSGPAVLRLSAWGARELATLAYKFPLEVDFAGTQSGPEVMEALQQNRLEHGKKQVANHAMFGLPARLWQRLVEGAGIDSVKRWADLSKTDWQALHLQLTSATFQITGKSTFKEEFVTAGGVSLKEIQFQTFESKVCPNLYMAGEVLDIDAITGGFNFQAAWTGGFLAGQAMSA
ncbi:MAG: NAD(P)/FAD-dependent oxidoreductase [Saprospiraceae bacterium]|nr:NAD(P)/FAD-dependent oxidoreductase [Saprospiraceae bacterium]